MTRQERLQSCFDFTEDDLKQNRLGRLTVAQKQALQKKTNREAARLFWFFMGLAAIFIVIDRVKFSSGSSPLSWAIPVVLIGIAAVSMLLRSIKRSNISLNSVSGKVDFTWEEQKVYDPENINRSTIMRRLKMRVGGRSFDADETLKNIIEPGENCRFYVTGGGDIVSAEFLEDSNGWQY